jgi:hypothetical protein
MPSHSYNSVIYRSKGIYNYLIFSVNQTSVDTDPANLYSLELSLSNYDNLATNESILGILEHLQKFALDGTLYKLDNEQCIWSNGRSKLVGSRVPLVSLMNEGIDIDYINDIQKQCAVDTVSWICPKSERRSMRESSKRSAHVPRGLESNGIHTG